MDSGRYYFQILLSYHNSRLPFWEIIRASFCFFILYTSLEHLWSPCFCSAYSDPWDDRAMALHCLFSYITTKLARLLKPNFLPSTLHPRSNFASFVFELFLFLHFISSAFDQLDSANHTTLLTKAASKISSKLSKLLNKFNSRTGWILGFNCSLSRNFLKLKQLLHFFGFSMIHSYIPT